MNIRTASIRHVPLAFRGVRHAATAIDPIQPSTAIETASPTSVETTEVTAPISLPEQEPRPEARFGEQIFAYYHLQKNHVVYSLDRAMNNNAALKQLPFNGKKTVPRALRKDLWRPLATITFPSGSPEIGLSAFQKLREFRRRHELEWTVDDLPNKGRDENGVLIPKKKRGRLLCDQKANSVADISAVLKQLSEQPITKQTRWGLKGEGTGAKVEVKWSDLMDAEFAKEWTENVVHDKLEPHTNNRTVGNIWGWEKHKALLKEQAPERIKAREEKRKKNEGLKEWYRSSEEGKANLARKKEEAEKRKATKEMFAKKKATAIKQEEKRRKREAREAAGERVVDESEKNIA